jgi:hypothetical protein
LIELCPESIKNFGNSTKAHFYLLTNPELINSFKIISGGKYESYQILPIVEESLELAIQKTKQLAHILVISPYKFINSVHPSSLGRRKLAVMATNSTPTSLKAIAHFMKIIEKSDPQEQRKFADRFFDNLEDADGLLIVDEKYGTQAKFIPDPENEWFEQLGILDWGQQQILPSGEISVLPLAHGQYDPSQRLNINGEITLQGFPILHSGASPNREEQARIYQALSVLEQQAIIATVENGCITKLEITHADAEPAKAMLQTLFDLDPNYRIIWELGFGINTKLELWSGNTAMNEVYGGDNGVLHFGLGLTSVTSFHLDILCPITNMIPYS